MEIAPASGTVEAVIDAVLGGIVDGGAGRARHMEPSKKWKQMELYARILANTLTYPTPCRKNRKNKLWTGYYLSSGGSNPSRQIVPNHRYTIYRPSLTADRFLLAGAFQVAVCHPSRPGDIPSFQG